MHQLNAYLFFDDNCADAMRFYERTLGGKLDLITHAQSPMAGQTPPESADKIMHARLTFDGGMLMASDWMSDQPYAGMHGFSLSLIYPTAAEARRMFDVLGEGGKVTIKLDFVKPIEGHNVAEFTLEPKGESTDVTWAMYGPTAYIAKIIGVFVSMDGMIGKEFETGLANLKAVAEK